MLRNNHIRATALAAAVVSLAILTGCSQKATPTGHLAKIEASKKVAQEKSKQIADLSNQRKEVLAAQNDAKKKLPILLAQSDQAFRLVQQYKDLAAKQKDAKKKLELQQRSSKAQAAADNKSNELISTHCSIYDNDRQLHDLDKQIASLTAEKKRAEQVAMGNTQPTPQKKTM